MKKSILTLSILVLIILSSCDPYGFKDMPKSKKIESARCLLYSFNENGIFPYLEKINKNELGISISHDSISYSDTFSTITKVPIKKITTLSPPEIKLVNAIDSVQIFTIYPFNSNYPVNSNVNDILQPIDIMGDFMPVDNISSLSFSDLLLKFTDKPTYDTLQFEVRFRITQVGNFTLRTNKVVVSD